MILDVANSNNNLTDNMSEVVQDYFDMIRHYL